MRFRARAAAAVVALPVVLGVAACGVTDKPTAGAKPAAAKTTPAPLKAPARLTAASFSPAMNAANAKAKSMESVVRINADGQVITMTMAQTLKPFATKLEMSSPALGGAAHIISIKSALYVAAPSAAPAGKYLKINLKRMLVYTVWVGADDLMYKMAYKMGSMDMQITVSSYNATSTIKPPPANKIYTR